MRNILSIATAILLLTSQCALSHNQAWCISSHTEYVKQGDIANVNSRYYFNIENTAMYTQRYKVEYVATFNGQEPLVLDRYEFTLGRGEWQKGGKHLPVRKVMDVIKNYHVLFTLRVTDRDGVSIVEPHCDGYIYVHGGIV